MAKENYSSSDEDEEVYELYIAFKENFSKLETKVKAFESKK